jgi:hypothetical protein
MDEITARFTHDHETVRAANIQSGRRLTYFTIAWNCLESVMAVGSGLIAGSIALVGFGVDSLI